MTDEEADELVRQIARTWGTISDLDDDYEVLQPMPPTRWTRRTGEWDRGHHNKGRRFPDKVRPTKVDWPRAQATASRIGVNRSNYPGDHINLARGFLLQARLIADERRRSAAYQRQCRRLTAELALAEERALLAVASPVGLAQEIARLQSVVAGLRQALIDQDDAWRRRLPEMVRRLGVAGRRN